MPGLCTINDGDYRVNNFSRRKSSIMMPAVESVFATEELLEAILVEVDMRTLLLSAQRVSRHWQSAINASLPLQRALFFQAERATEAVEPGFTPRKTQNPLLKDIFPAWFENIDGFTPRPRPGVNPVHYFPATAMMGYKRFEELPLYQTSLRSDDNPFLRPDASWRRMLTSQPPCFAISTNIKRGPGASMGKGEGEGGLMRHEGGVRMGSLYNITLGHSVGHFVSGFMVIWLGSGEEGYVDLKRHLRRMSGIVPVQSEQGVQRLWKQRPDLFVQMLWTEGRPRRGDVPKNDLGMFWERCGAEHLSVEGEGSAVAEAQGVQATTLNRG